MDIVVATAADETLLLDLLNTTPVIDGVPQDILSERAAADGWLHDHGVAATDAEWNALRDARTALQGVVRGDLPNALQRFVAGGYLRPAVTDAGLDWQVVADRTASGALRAVLAWDRLRISSPGRLRACANTECQLFLLDRSKPNTARWCSMAGCGNREKARRHYQRTRSEAS